MARSRSVPGPHSTVVPLAKGVVGKEPGLADTRVAGDENQFAVSGHGPRTRCQGPWIVITANHQLAGELDVHAPSIGSESSPRTCRVLAVTSVGDGGAVVGDHVLS